MKNFTTNPNRARTRYQTWTWIAVAASILVCVLIAGLHFKQQESLRSMTEAITTLHLARIELAKGFLYVTLSDDPEAPFSRDEGLVLLRQASTSFEASMNINADMFSESDLAEFKQSLSEFQTKLDEYSASPTPRLETELRIAFHNLESQANQVDGQSHLRLEKLASELNRGFALTLSGAALLLLGVCIMMVFAGQAGEKADAGLQEREQKLVQLLNILPVGVSILDSENKVVFSNPTLQKILHMTDEGISTGVYKKRSYITSDGSPMNADNFASSQAAKTGKPIHAIETGIVTESGETIWTNVSAVPMNFPDWKMVITTTDITERKEADEKLRESEERFRSILDNMIEGCQIIDFDWRYVYVNDTVAGHGHNTREALIGHTMMEKYPGIEETELFSAMRDCMENHVVHHMENKFIYPDGSIGYFELGIQPVKEGVFILSVDVTSRKKMENQLKENERQYRELVQNANSAILRWKSNGDIAFFNEFAASFFGYSPKEVLGKPVSILVPPTDSTGDDLSELVQSIAQNPEQFANVVNENIRKDGSRVWMAWTNKPVYDENGQVMEILAVGSDITGQKQMEEELRRSNAELEQFAYIASHDLQEPLRAVAGMVQLLQKRYEGKLDERADEYIGHAVEAAGRMQALIQALLSYSRVERRNQPIELIDAGECLDAALKNLTVAIRESHAKVTADPMPKVQADPTQLTQIFQNLIGNGIKFQGNEEPQIHISATQLKDTWQFSVRDNGIGIEPQYFERIFLIFQRLHTRREYSGTGIGLALCKKIIERHRGSIWVESHPNEGSTFHFTLPIRSTNHE